MSVNDIGPLERLVNATRYSIRGLRYAWTSEPAFRYEIYVLFVALPVAWLIGKSGVERALLIGSVLLVVVVELVNSAIEATVNRIGRERHELSGYAKDMGSAAVFISILLAASVWSVVLLS